MRRDVLELMAEEISGRPVDALASFTNWDDGRRKLDGMAKGKRWDIDREQRSWERDNAADLRVYGWRARNAKWRKAHPQQWKAIQAAYIANHKDAYLALHRRAANKYYAANRDAVNARRRAAYAAKKGGQREAH